jgi:crenactin
MGGAALDPRRALAAYGEDYGTRYFKYGPLVEQRPRVVESVGLFLEESHLLKMFGIEKQLVVGEDVKRFLGARSALARSVVYPLTDGEVRRDDERAWQVLAELSRRGFDQFKGLKESKDSFDGFYVTAALSAIAPEYMREELLKIHAKIDRELGLVKAFTVIPQPLAVAIAEKEISCVVVESGHGNTQITPIHTYPIREAVVALYRGGAEADAIAAEVLKDLGYGDLASDEMAVRRFKEEAGLIPLDLSEALKKAKENPERFRCKVRLSTLTEIDLEDKGWYRFLIGEVVFNPAHELFESFRKKGVLSIRDARLGEETVEGTLPLEEALLRSIRKTPTTLHDALLNRIILSGGNFQWKVPENLKDVAASAPLKVKHLLGKRLGSGVNVEVRLTQDPQFSVWKGCVVWSLALPENYLWNEKRGEGWFKRGVHY